MNDSARQTGRRGHRRVQLPGAPGADPRPQQDLRTRPERASDDTDRAWGDSGDGNDRMLRENVPPHWGRR